MPGAACFRGTVHTVRFKDTELVTAAVMGLVSYLITDDVLVTLSLATIWLVCKLVTTNDGLLVLPLAMSFHWMQGTVGLLYLGFLGRAVPTAKDTDYRPMVLIALGCCLALAAGIRLGLSLRRPSDLDNRPESAFSFAQIVIAYAATVGFEGSILVIAPMYPTIRQILVTIDFARLGLLYLLLRRLTSPRIRGGLIAVVIGGEVVLGITGFFAGFREPLVLAALAFLEVFDRRDKRHIAALMTLGVVSMSLAVVWMGIRSQYRREYLEVDQFANTRSARVDRVRDLTGNFLSNTDNLWATADAVVDRMWTVGYPAMALKRVPSVISHTDGAIMTAALLHIVTPRLFFPDKAELPSDSDEVRKYSGMYVAGRETNTSIAFGYSIESYIDFGLPWMFLPVLLYGVFIGVCYAVFSRLIRHRDISVAFLTVTFWMSVYIFERSWATMLGIAVGFMVYLGGPTVLLDRFLLIRTAAQPVDASEPAAMFEAEGHRAP
jgi:hypothetical protein